MGYYYAKYKITDKNSRYPTYGDQARWDGRLSLNSKLIKQNEFSKQADLCPKIIRNILNSSASKKSSRSRSKHKSPRQVNIMLPSLNKEY